METPIPEKWLLRHAFCLSPIRRRSPYLGGAKPCATDLAIFPFVRQFAAVEPRWFAEQELPALRAWLDGWLENGLFEVCMTKLPPQSVANFPALVA